jgi:uncharacterized protein YndB with AHSA1/START domain
VPDVAGDEVQVVLDGGRGNLDVVDKGRAALRRESGGRLSGTPRLVRRVCSALPLEGAFMTETNTGTEKHDLVVARIFAAPVDQVWKAWTDGEEVKRWWGPHGFTAPVAEMDVREGARSLVCMRAPKEFGGQDMYNTWTYRKIEPHKRLEFVVNFTDQHGNKLDPAHIGLPPGIPQDVPHVITFKPLDGGRTEMTVNEFGYTSKQAHDLSRAGLEQVLDKMAASFSTKSR